MWPQKWNASARWARRAAATKPLPLSASIRRPVRARNPRRELFPATASLSMHGLGCCDQETLELEERVEGPLGPHLSVRGEDHRVRAARHAERGPDVGVRLLVEELQLDLRVGGGEAQRRLESGAERAARRRPHRAAPNERRPATRSANACRGSRTAIRLGPERSRS